LAVDLTGDGKLDLVGFSGGLPPEGDLKVAVYLGNGDGTFQDARFFDLGTEGLGSAEVVARDFDGDGRLDLAVLYRMRDERHSFVTVLLGNGDGTFRATQAHQVANGGDTFPEGLVAGDFTGHGRLDLVVTNRNGDISVLAGNGDGTFQDPVTLHTSARPIKVAAGDLRGNGISDLIVTDSGEFGSVEPGFTVSVLLGNGDGTFQAPVTYQVGVAPIAILVDDLGGDHIPDVAVANSASNSVSVLLGNGDGTFQSAVNYLVGTGPGSLVAADLGGDKALDLAVANFRSNDVSVLLNRAGGPGGAPSGPAAGLTRPQSPAAVDALFAGARPESRSPAVVRQSPAAAAVDAVFSASQPEAVTLPPQQPAVADAGTLTPHRQARVEAADAAGLPDPLAAGLTQAV
jgi:hypothetical protein